MSCPITDFSKMLLKILVHEKVPKTMRRQKLSETICHIWKMDLTGVLLKHTLDRWIECLFFFFLHYTILYYIILHYTVLYTIIYYTMLCYTMQYYTMLYYTMLCYTTLYYTIHFEHLLGVWLLSRGILNVLTNFAGKIDL